MDINILIFKNLSISNLPQDVLYTIFSYLMEDKLTFWKIPTHWYSNFMSPEEINDIYSTKSKDINGTLFYDLWKINCHQILLDWMIENLDISKILEIISSVNDDKGISIILKQVLDRKQCIIYEKDINWSLTVIICCIYSKFRFHTLRMLNKYHSKLFKITNKFIYCILDHELMTLEILERIFSFKKILNIDTTKIRLLSELWSCAIYGVQFQVPKHNPINFCLYLISNNLYLKIKEFVDELWLILENVKDLNLLYLIKENIGIPSSSSIEFMPYHNMIFLEFMLKYLDENIDLEILKYYYYSICINDNLFNCFKILINKENIIDRKYIYDLCLDNKLPSFVIYMKQKNPTLCNPEKETQLCVFMIENKDEKNFKYFCNNFSINSEQCYLSAIENKNLNIIKFLQSKHYRMSDMIEKIYLENLENLRSENEKNLGIYGKPFYFPKNYK
jgi:hypothetical protein